MEGRNGPQDVPAARARSARISEVAVRRIGRLRMGLPPGLGRRCSTVRCRWWCRGARRRAPRHLESGRRVCLARQAHDQRLQIGGKVRDSIAQTRHRRIDVRGIELKEVSRSNGGRPESRKRRHLPGYRCRCAHRRPFCLRSALAPCRRACPAAVRSGSWPAQIRRKHRRQRCGFTGLRRLAG